MKSQTVTGGVGAAVEAIPALAEVSPTFAEVAQRHEKVHGRYQELDAEIQALIGELAEKNTGEKPGGRRQGRGSSRVDELLGGLSTDKPRLDLREKRARLDAARADRAAHAEALEHLRRLVADAKSRASIQVCDLVRPRYSAIVAEMCEALLAVRKKQLAYHQLIDELEAADVAWVHLFPMPLRFLGAPNDNEGSLAKYLKEAADHGFIQPEIIPHDLRWDRPSKAGW